MASALNRWVFPLSCHPLLHLPHGSYSGQLGPGNGKYL
jgi:hypothetical protein